MNISVKNLGIAVNPNRTTALNETGITNLSKHIDSLSEKEKTALVKSTIKDVEKGGHNLLKLIKRNPKIFNDIIKIKVQDKRGRDTDLEHIVRNEVSNPKNKISPNKAMTIFTAINKNKVSDMATHYALRTSTVKTKTTEDETAPNDFIKLATTIDGLVHAGLNMDAVGEIIVQSVSQSWYLLEEKIETDNPNTNDGLLLVKSMIKENISPETKRLMDISDSFKEMASKSESKKELLNQFIELTTSIENKKALKDNSIDVQKSETQLEALKRVMIEADLKIKTVEEAQTKKKELAPSILNSLSLVIPATLKTITASTLADIDSMASKQNAKKEIKDYFKIKSLEDQKEKTEIPDLAFEHLANACLQSLQIDYRVSEAKFEEDTPRGTLEEVEVKISDFEKINKPASLMLGKKEFTINEFITQGSAGKIFNYHQGNEKGIVKMIRIDDDSAQTRKEALKEVYNSDPFKDHPNIMRPSSFAFTQVDENNMQYLAVFMPKADKGDMDTIVKGFKDTVTSLEEQTPTLLKLLTDTANGLSAMHLKGFFHGDIKPDNIFCKTNQANELIGMVGDLGTTLHESEFESSKLEGRGVYLPSDDKVSLSADSYSVGMMAFQVLSGGSFPFQETKEAEFDDKQLKYPFIKQSILESRIKERLTTTSPEIQSLIARSLSDNPEDRPTMIEWKDTLARSRAQ